MEEKAKILIEKLKEIDNDRDFIFSVLSLAETEENFETLIELIDENAGLSSSRVILMAMALDEYSEK